MDANHSFTCRAVEPVLSLVERLKLVAALWCLATGRTPGALSTIVANHGSFFDRLDAPEAGTTTATLEKFARFLVKPDNWPAGLVPQEVCQFAHAVGITPDPPAPSPDIAAPLIGGGAALSASSSTPLGTEPGPPAALALDRVASAGAEAAGDDLQVVP